MRSARPRQAGASPSGPPARRAVSPPVGHPGLESSGEVRGGPGRAPLVERDDPRAGRHGAEEPLALPADGRRGPCRSLAGRPAAVGGRNLPQNEPAGGGKPPGVLLERFTHPSRHPGSDRRQHDLHPRTPGPGADGRGSPKTETSRAFGGIMTVRGPERLRGPRRRGAPLPRRFRGADRRGGPPRARAAGSGWGAPAQVGGAAVRSRTAITGDQSFSSW